VNNAFVANSVGAQLGDGSHTDSLHGSTVTENVFVRNGSAGLVLDSIADEIRTIGVSIQSNSFVGNGFEPGDYTATDGQVVAAGAWINVGPFAAPVTLTNNSAIHNGGPGIESYGAIDGGGNTATRNESDAQCIGVVCS
jgi:hypothetical protein